ncbi:heavy metal translocating P-type ATPase [Coleofasciculus sp. G2-EDA-02]|uniref:heavy metal translocating P-type ATPase n=1 Tax=Coleofasciculus sp. G2-EDA-02 TaxID=3069529 RepID=UPI0032F2522B
MKQVVLKSGNVSQKQIAAVEPKSPTVVERTKPKTRQFQVTYRVVHSTPGRVRFRIPRIAHDSNYAQRLQRLLAAEPQVTSVRLKPAAASVVIRYLPGEPDSQMRSRLGKVIQLATNAALTIPGNITSTQPENSAKPGDWSRLKLPTLATLISLVSGPLGLSFHPLILGGTIALATIPVARRALESITQERRLNVDFLDLAAITIITAQRHFLTSCSMLGLIELGEAIRERTARSSRNQTLDLLSSLAQFVWVERNGEKQQIPIEQVQPEDTVIVYPGDQIPVDGQILQGKALIDEQKLTGEAMPVVRSEGDSVYASTLLREGQLYILAERIGADTLAGRTLKLLQDAPVHDTRVENYAAKIADRMVVPTLLLGGVIFALTRNAARAASILTIDFATGIRVSVPTTVMAAMLSAARQGILLRSGRALEQLARVDAIVFDKTGTLTQGDVAIIGITTADSAISELEVLRLAAAAEQRITHPVAEAVMRYANYQEVIIPQRGEWDYQVGLGIQAQIEGQTVLVGSERFLVKEGIDLESFYTAHPEVKTTEYPTIYVASNGRLLGILQYTDPLRPESAEVIAMLRDEMGAEIHILTGDNCQRAAVVAAQLNIPPSHTYAEAFPQRKAEVVQQLHEAGKTVAFVGDGLNDSAALAYADVSVSFRDGSDIARETADVVLMQNNLRGLVEAIAIARNAKQIIRQNTKIVAVPNLSGLAIAATVGLNPMTATLINNGSSVIAGVNGLRPALKRDKAAIDVEATSD